MCERDDTQFWKDCTSMPIPPKLKKILDKHNSITVRNDIELLKSFELVGIEPNELTFFVNNYLVKIIFISFVVLDLRIQNYLQNNVILNQM